MRRLNATMAVGLVVFVCLCAFMAHVNAQPDHPHKHTSFNIIAVMPDSPNVAGAYMFYRAVGDVGPWTYADTVVAGPGQPVSVMVNTAPSGEYRCAAIVFQKMDWSETNPTVALLSAMQVSSQTVTINRRGGI